MNIGNTWPHVRLGEVLEYIPRPVEPQPNEMYSEIGIRSHGRGIFHKNPVPGLDLGSKRVFRIEPGDFVLNIVFAWEGAVAIAGDSEIGMIASHRFPTFRSRGNSLDLRFLLAFLQTPDGLALLGRVSPGGAGRNRTLSKQAFLEQRIPLPPMAEQVRLADHLEKIMKLVQEATILRSESNRELDQMVVSLAHRSDLSDAEKLSSGWKRCALRTILSQTMDEVRVQEGEVYPSAGVFGFGRGLFKKPPLQAEETKYQSLFRLRTGQFVYSRLKAFEGAYAYVSRDFDCHFVSQEFPTFECEPTALLSEFLFAYFKRPKVWLELAAFSKGIGARRERLHPDAFLSYTMLVPPLDYQLRVRDALTAYFASRNLRQQQHDELEALGTSVLNRAFQESSET